MKKIANFIVKARFYFLGAFLLLLIGSIIMLPFVNVNYDVSKYLPSSSGTSQAYKIMQDEFGSNGSAIIMITETSEQKTNAIKNSIESVDGVSSVVITRKQGTDKILFNIYLETNDYQVETEIIIKNIQTKLNGINYSLAGGSAEAIQNRQSITGDMPIMMVIAFIIIFIILIFTSKSWFEPVLLAIVLGTAIIINLGTNLIFGEISFVSNAICAIMQMALAIDYSIVLLNRYNEEKSKGSQTIDSMKVALTKCFSPISSSSLTTLAGLIALMFMQFTIGLDIGLVLSKGIIISMLTVFLLMPSLILIFEKPLNKSKHKNFIPKMDFLAKFSFKAKYVMPVLLVAIIIAAGVGQSFVGYFYTLSVKEKSDVYNSTQEINKEFGEQNPLVIMVKKGNYEKEAELINYISNLEINNKKYVNNAQGISTTGLYAIVTKQDIIDYGISESYVNQIYALLNKTEEDKVYLIELIKLLSTKNLIASYTTLMQINADSITKDVYALITLSQAQENFGLTETQAKALYSTILEVPIEEINASSSVLNYLLIEAIYNNTPTPNETITNAYNQMYAMLSKNDISTKYGFDEATVNALFDIMQEDVNASILAYKVFKAITDTQFIKNVYGLNYQNQINMAYEQAQLATKMFESKNYSRLIFNLNLSVTNEDSTKFIEKLRTDLPNYYNEFYIVNPTAMMMDVKASFDKDVILINILSVAAIFIIVLIAFRSVIIPLILLLAIESAIFLNIAFNALYMQPVFFVCYLLALCIQMGATIDYGILLTNRYIEARKSMDKLQSVKFALNNSISTILTSGAILTLAPYCICWFSTMPIISQIGRIIGRGALISCLIILFFLPAMLLLCDKLVTKQISFKRKSKTKELKE